LPASSARARSTFRGKICSIQERSCRNPWVCSGIFAFEAASLDSASPEPFSRSWRSLWAVRPGKSWKVRYFRNVSCARLRVAFGRDLPRDFQRAPQCSGPEPLRRRAASLPSPAALRVSREAGLLSHFLKVPARQDRANLKKKIFSPVGFAAPALRG
jgi:hypothetical protein